MSTPKPATAVEFLPDADEIERRPLPVSARLTIHLLVAALALFVLWASVSYVDQVVVAQGRLITPLPNIVVQPLETSIIQSIDVRIGQVVKKGERLATLDPTFTAADQAQLEARLRSLETQAQRLQAELAGDDLGIAANGDADAKLQAQLSTEREATYQAQLQRLDESIGRLRASLDANRKDQQLLATRLDSLKEIEAMQTKLVQQNLGARLGALEAKDRRLEVERELQLAQNRERELRRQLGEAEADKAAFASNWRQQAMEALLATTRERDALAEQLQKAEKRRNLVTLTAPADAVVLNIAKLSPGSIIKEAEPMFTLVALGETLIAEVQIDAGDVGYVKAGDSARIKLHAFPFQRHGSLSGSVRTISQDAFRRDTHEAGAYYLAQLDLGPEKLRNMSESARLLPGMTLNAEIVVGQRSVMSYLIWPLTKALDESIREP